MFIFTFHVYILSCSDAVSSVSRSYVTQSYVYVFQLYYSIAPCNYASIAIMDCTVI